ncbi:MAG: signal recognition particle protein [Candidatus Diapherotrites archaeon]|nr:signal recognition particle protein [Candidatus Diapherotrites archaeon]
MVVSKLAHGLRGVVSRVSGAALVDKELIRSSLKELQRTLISSDVNVRLVLELTKSVERRLSDVPPGVRVKEYFVKAVYDELVALLGEKHSPELGKQRILLCGTYGHGKTTTAGKLAKFFSKRGLRTALITTDTWRPAAYEQVQQLAQQVGVPMFGVKGERDSERILRAGLEKFSDYDVIIADSAGRDSLDEDLLDEIKALNAIFLPEERYLVLGADMGQTAGRQAKAFHEAIGLTGVVLTRVDSSAKGGGALSACAEAGVPVTFIGTGEKMEDLEVFDAEKYVSRLLGFPDLSSLLVRVKEATEDSELSEEDLMQRDLTLTTFYKQLEATKKMGSLSKVMEMMGLSQKLPEELVEEGEEKMRVYKHIIDSMTKYEREHPDEIKKSRVERIARGSGRSEKEVKELLKQFNATKKMFSKLKKGKRLPGKFGALMKQFKGGVA